MERNINNLSLAVGQIVEKSRNLSFGKATNLTEGKSWIQTSFTPRKKQLYVTPCSW